MTRALATLEAELPLAAPGDQEWIRTRPDWKVPSLSVEQERAVLAVADSIPRFQRPAGLVPLV